MSFRKLQAFALVFSLILIGMLGAVSAQTLNVNSNYANEVSTITQAADRLVALQNPNGSWDWAVTNKTEPTSTTYLNIAGVTAQGLLDAYNITGDSSYLGAAKKTGDYLLTQYGNQSLSPDLAAVTGKTKHVNAFNVKFLYDLGSASGNSDYTNEANLLMNLVTSTYPAALDLVSAQKTARGTANGYGIVAWDLYNYVSDAQMNGNSSWAGDLKTAIVSDSDLSKLQDSDKTYIIGLSALSVLGDSNATQELTSNQSNDSSWSDYNGIVQDTAYALMALSYLNDSYLTDKFGYNSLNGWLESDGNEYSEVTSEAVQALAAHLISEGYSNDVYLTIQDAINAAHDNDTIVVYDGNYSGFSTSFSLGPNNITIKAAEGAKPNIIASSVPFNSIKRLLDLRANGTILSGFNIIGNNVLGLNNSYVGVSISGQNITLENNNISGLLTGVQTTTQYPEGNVQILNNNISNVGYGISLQNNYNILKNNFVNATVEGLGVGSHLDTNNNTIFSNYFATEELGHLVEAYFGSQFSVIGNYWGVNNETLINSSMINVENITFSPWYTDSSMKVLASTVTKNADNSTSINLPQMNASKEITVDNKTQTITVEVPANITIKGNSSWDGTLSLIPELLSNISISKGKVGKAIEIGLSGVKLTFDKAVKIVIPGEGGSDKKVGYSYDNGTTITQISACTISKNETNLGEGEDCYYDNSTSGDIIIWTKHFTQFITYTPTPAPAPSNSGSSGGGGYVYGPSPTQTNNNSSVNVNETNQTSTAGNETNSTSNNNPSGNGITGGVIGALGTGGIIATIAGLLVLGTATVVFFSVKKKRKSKK